MHVQCLLFGTILGAYFFRLSTCNYFSIFQVFPSAFIAALCTGFIFSLYDKYCPWCTLIQTWGISWGDIHVLIHSSLLFGSPEYRMAFLTSGSSSSFLFLRTLHDPTFMVLIHILKTYEWIHILKSKLSMIILMIKYNIYSYGYMREILLDWLCWNTLDCRSIMWFFNVWHACA